MYVIIIMTKQIKRKKSLSSIISYAGLIIISVIGFLIVFKITENIYFVYKVYERSKEIKLLSSTLNDLFQKAQSGQDVDKTVYVPENTYISYHGNVIVISSTDVSPQVVTTNCLIDWPTVPNEEGKYEIRISVRKNVCYVDSIRISNE